MKKTLSLLTAFLLLLSFASCVSPAADDSASPSPTLNENRPVMNVAALKGPTAMGMIGLMRDDEDNTSAVDYEFTVSGAVDEIGPLLIQGKADVASVPANLAAVLYANTDGQLAVLAVNTLGVLYMMETGDAVQTFADLKGKTIYLSGKGAVPEYSLLHLLKQNGLDPASDVTLEFKSEHTEVVAALATDPDGVGLLPEPFITTASQQNDALRVCLDLTAEWDAVSTDSAMITGVVVARRAYLDANPDAVNTFLDEYAASVAFVNTDIPESASLIEKYGIFPAAVAEKAIPACNIVCIAGDEMQTMLEGYLTVLHEQKPEAVGGALPDEAFYYKP